jgi:hypothetical protein
MADKEWTVKELSEALNQFPVRRKKSITRWGQTAQEQLGNRNMQGLGRRRQNGSAAGPWEK